MDVVTIVMLVMLLGSAGIVWYLVRRYLRQTSNADLDSVGDAGAIELAAFVAAYRSGQIDPRELQSDNAAAAGSAAPAAAPTAAPAMPAAAKPVAAKPVAARPQAAKPSAPGVLLRPEVKLAYLSLRTGMRDHHAFPNVPLSDLGLGDVAGRVDLIICNSNFAIVAAIDVFAGAGVSDPDKDRALRSAGIRYLRFNAKAMPRPGDLRELIYQT